MVSAPDGSEVSIGNDGQVDVVLPDARTGKRLAAPSTPASIAEATRGSGALLCGHRSLLSRRSPEVSRAMGGALKVPLEETNFLGMRMVLIPPGEFDMGSTQEEIHLLIQEAKAAKEPWLIDRLHDETPRHRVRITQPFRLGATK